MVTPVLGGGLMARTTVDIDAPLDAAWTALQQLATWEGVAGIEDLHDPQHDVHGGLSGFRFAMETPVGRVRGAATAQSTKPSMKIRAEQKGLEIVLRVLLRENDEACTADVDAQSRATTFFNKPLELTLNAVLDSSIRDEAAKIASRIC